MASDDSKPRPPELMAQGMAYPTATTYMPGPYYPAPLAQPHASVHIVAPPPRPEPQQRKRPKYTRSKTGCLTCRTKKVKCDETKPSCMRCTHANRECTWPEGVSTRKKSGRHEGEDGRPSTADSMSEASTPPTRNNTPPKDRRPADVNLPPLASRRIDAYSQRGGVSTDNDVGRRQNSASAEPFAASQSNPQSNDSSMIPEIQSYPAQSRYDASYANSTTNGIQLAAGSRGQPNGSNGRMVAQNYQAPYWNPSPSNSIESLTPHFHSMQERNLIRHYWDHSTGIIMAVPSRNPVVDINLPLVLGQPPGDPPAEALRLALLGVAAIHQSFLLSRNGGNQDAATNLMRQAYAFRMHSKQVLAQACTTVEGTHSDASLSASIAISLMDIFSGGRNWLKNMDLAKTLVNVRGGPAALLAPGSVLSPESLGRVSRARLLLEILAVYDIFGCFGSGKAPTVLTPDSSWWMNDASNSYVEEVFGMSREFVPLLSRALTFVSQCLDPTSARIVEVVDGVTDFGDLSRTTECQELYNVLETWLPALDKVPPRVALGNLIYQKTSQIMLLRDVMHSAPEDMLVQGCADTILTLTLQCASNKMSVDLLWPVIIAGSLMFGADRARVIEVFQNFRAQCCYEILTSERIVLEVWRRSDQGQARADWRSVMQDLNLNVLIC